MMVNISVVSTYLVTMEQDNRYIKCSNWPE